MFSSFYLNSCLTLVQQLQNDSKTEPNSILVCDWLLVNRDILNFYFIRSLLDKLLLPMMPSWGKKSFLWEERTGKVVPTQKTLTDILILLPFNIWEGKINPPVYLPNGKAPSWLEGKNYFQTSEKILQLTKKCEIKLNKTQKYVIVLFLPSLFIPPNSPVYPFFASFDLSGLSCDPFLWFSW